MMSLLQQNITSNNKYVVRFAQDWDEVKYAQRLRFNVFNVELGEGLSSSLDEQLDADKYDEQCHHLLVIHKKTGQVIGTYRMQTHEMARDKMGFYTDEEFDMKTIPDQIISNSVEVGRACIANEHRNGRVLFLLWRGIAQYLLYTKCQYLFGCCSLTSQSPREAWEVMQYLRENDYTHPEIMISTTKKYRCDEVDISDKTDRDLTLPQLFRLYMDLGAKVCSPPAIDREFKTIDYLILLDIDNLDERTRMLFFN